MYLAEMPHLQDSLNQMLEIPEFLAAEHMKVKGNFYFHFLRHFAPHRPHLLILVLWVVPVQDSNAGESDYLIPFEIVIFLKDGTKQHDYIFNNR